MKYKLGDKVRIKSLDWYNENKDNCGAIYAGNGFVFWKNMVRHCDEIMKITIVKVDPEDSNKGYYFMENSEEKWTDEMIEGLVEEETKPEPKFKVAKFRVGDSVKVLKSGNIYTISKMRFNGKEFVYGLSNNGNTACWFSEKEIESPKEDNNDCKKCGLVRNSTRCLFMDNCPHNKQKNIIEIPEDYLIKDENGNVINATKIVLEKKKKEYPKTYEECCKVLGYSGNYNMILTTDVDNKLFKALYKLKVCRDAYWKIAGEEMGLGKDLSWVPDWMCVDRLYAILYRYHYICKAEVNGGTSCILAFPTVEMRDAFYENFKGLIEECKELL